MHSISVLQETWVKRFSINAKCHCNIYYLPQKLMLLSHQVIHWLLAPTSIDLKIFHLTYYKGPWGILKYFIFVCFFMSLNFLTLIYYMLSDIRYWCVALIRYVEFYKRVTLCSFFFTNIPYTSWKHFNFSKFWKYYLQVTLDHLVEGDVAKCF